jgi:regulator of protease activity HflC (stomatin/prohibitin superfamily)
MKKAQDLKAGNPVKGGTIYLTAADESGMTRSEIRRSKAGPLHPLRDGSLITGDSNIVHGKWAITWRVGNRAGDPESFLTNVGTQKLAADIVRLVGQQGIVQAVAQLPAEEFLRGIVNRELAVGLMQDRLDAMRCGLVIDQLTLDQVSAPVSVVASFDAVTVAESDRARQIVGARQNRARILGETAGEASDKLIGLLAAYEESVTREDRPEAARLETLFDEGFGNLTIDGLAIGGQVAQIINNAKSYRTQVVETVGAEAQAFRQLMPQYRQNPRLVLSKLWEDARETILTGDVETFYTVPGQLELQLNRDPELQKERQQEQLRANKREQKAQRRR